MQDVEAFVRSNLGENIQPISLVVVDLVWQGWQYFSFQGQSISVAEARNIEAKRPEIRTLVNQLWMPFHQKNIRLWSHFGVDILAVPAMPVLDIINYEQVGSHWSNSEPTIATIHNSIRAIFNECPFEIPFANSTALEAIFLQPIDRAQAEKFQEIIESIAIDSINLMCHELYGDDELDFTDNRLTTIAADYIQQKQKLILCWD